MKYYRLMLLFFMVGAFLLSFPAAHAQEIEDCIYWSTKGYDYYKNGDYKKAIACYTRAIKLCPDSDCLSRNYLHRGNCRNILGKYRRALKDYSRLVELDPSSHSGYKGRGHVYYDRGKYKKALIEYTAAIERNPRDGYGYYDRSQAYYREGRYDKALEDVNYALTLESDWAFFWMRSTIYRELNRYDEAMADIENAVVMMPTSPLVYYARGKNYEAVGEKKKALEDYARACDMGKEKLKVIQPAVVEKKIIREFCNTYERLEKELGK